VACRAGRRETDASAGHVGCDVSPTRSPKHSVRSAGGRRRPVSHTVCPPSRVRRRDSARTRPRR
jgi:hypothetical protein